MQISDTPVVPYKGTLNAGQQAAADAFFEFLFSNEKEFDIRGAGGVGKTFLMSHLIDRIIPQYMAQCKLMGIKPVYREVAMTATTNKAADVLAHATRRPTSTIFSFLGLRPSTDYNTGKTKLIAKQGTKPKSNMVLFIDEASMIDNPLYYHIHRLVDETCKVVYVGDQNQLAPVNEKISPIYLKEILNAELTENVRASAQPALLAINEQLRQTVKTGIFRPIQGVPGVIDILDGDEVEATVKKLFAQNTFDHRILCYTNAQALAYNEYIRSLRNLPPGITEGEVLICNFGVQTKNLLLTPETELQIVKLGKRKKWESRCQKVELDIQYAKVRTSFGSEIDELPIAIDAKDRIEVAKYLKKHGDIQDFIFLDERVADLRHRDAGTVHKAQGSTYHTVVVDLDDISKCHNRDTAARMLYVAFSRAKQRIVLHGRLPYKFGGLVE